MSTTHSEQALLIRDHRRRRWVIRICVTLLFMIMILAVAGFVLLNPTGMTAEQAESAFAELKANNNRERAESLLGKPYSEDIENEVTRLSWQYYTHGLMKIDVFHCTMICDQQGKVRSSNSIKVRVEGWEAWRWRWNKVKQRLGIK